MNEDDIDWVLTDDKTTNLLPAERNYWFLNQGGSWVQQIDRDPATNEPWASRLKPSEMAVDYEPWIQLAFEPTCNALEPPGAHAGRQHGSAVERPRDGSEVPDLSVPGENLHGLPTANAIRILGTSRSHAAFDFELAVPPGKEGRYTLEVFNLSGRRVATLFDQVSAAGLHRVSWRGRDAEGGAVGSGIYFIRASGPTWHGTLKAVLVR